VSHAAESADARVPLRSREHLQWTPLARALVAVGDRWTLLIVTALARGPQRLADLRARLPGISAGVLDRHLQQMVELELVLRRRYRELPPRVEYRLTAAGAALVPVAVELSRWGIRNVWSRPQPRERIAIGEILGLVPVMLAGERFPVGMLELVVEEPKSSIRHVFDIGEDGRLVAVEPGTVDPATRMAGAPHDWVDALGPRRNYAALRVSGEERLARRLLTALLE
jgi:DNA-binding HxlR family transcriptional regulator